jgi:hypothetical protein
MLLGNMLFNKIMLALDRGLRMLLLGCALGAMSLVIMLMPVRLGARTSGEKIFREKLVRT